MHWLWYGLSAVVGGTMGILTGLRLNLVWTGRWWTLGLGRRP